MRSSSQAELQETERPEAAQHRSRVLRSGPRAVGPHLEKALLLLLAELADDRAVLARAAFSLEALAAVLTAHGTP